MGSCRGAESSPEPSRGRGTRPVPVAEGSPLREGGGEAGPGEGAAFAARRSFTSTFPRRDPERQTPFRDSAHVRMKGGSPWPDRTECKYVGYSKDRFHRTSLRRTPSPRCRSQALPAPPCWKGNSPIYFSNATCEPVF